MSNASRAVTRTRRAVTTRKGTRIGAVPWPGPAVYRDPPAGPQQPPLAATRRAPKSRAPQGQPLRYAHRLVSYTAPGGPVQQLRRLTPAQRRRLGKKLRHARSASPAQKDGAAWQGPVQPKNPKGKP
ncbi:MAG TPA: hypothetical protein VK586_17800 [Streptosporangiaceae bacterium]|nr:hypothetical protein [Streptosporangiaceae bacterium]